MLTSPVGPVDDTRCQLELKHVNILLQNNTEFVLLALMLSLRNKSTCYDVRINYAQLNSRPTGVPELLIYL